MAKTNYKSGMAEEESTPCINLEDVDDDITQTLNHALMSTHQMATQREKLLEQLHELTDNITLEKIKYETANAEVKKTQGQYSKETLMQHAERLKNDVGRMMENISIYKDNYIIGDLSILEKEAHTLKTAMEQCHKNYTHTISNYRKNLQEAQKQESALTFKLWQIEDVYINTKNNLEHLKMKESDIIAKMEGGVGLGQSLLKLAQEETQVVKRNITEVADTCKVLSDA